MRATSSCVAPDHRVGFVARPRGVWIFTDMERLTPIEREEAAAFRNVLDAQGAATRVLNDPIRTKGRFALLRALYTEGLNAFDVMRLDDTVRPDRFPVFIRGEHDHDGAPAELIGDAAALDRAIATRIARGQSLEGRLIVEFAGGRDERGLYRKYAAWCIGERIVPGHLFFGSSWMLKEPEVVDDELLEIETAYLEQNPHEDQLRRAFSLGSVSYGRADYSVVNGQVQIYEINTNPGIPSAPSPGVGARRVALDQDVNQRLIDAFEALA